MASEEDVAAREPAHGLAIWWRLYIILAVVSVGMIGTMAYIYWAANRLVAHQAPLAEAAMAMRLETVTGYLWLEEVLAGVPDAKIAEVWAHFGQARWYLDAMLEGGTNSKGRFLPAADEGLRREVRTVGEQLARFEDVSRARYAQRATMGPGSRLHRDQHALLRALLQTADKVESGVQRSLEVGLSRFRITQAVLISMGVAVAFLVGAVFHRFERRRMRSFLALRQARRETSESEERFRRLVQHAPDAIFLHDLDGSVVDANPRACESLGYEIGDLLGRNLADLQADPPPGAPGEPWTSAVPGTPFTFEASHRRRDGSTFPVEVHAEVFEWGPRRLVLGLARDVTERRQAEEALHRARNELERRVEERTLALSAANRELKAEVTERRRVEEELRYSEQKYSTLVENSPAGIFIYRGDRIVFANRRLAALLDSPEVEVSGLEPDAFLHPEDRSAVTDALRRQLGSGEPLPPVEARVQSRTGQTIWLLLTTAPLWHRGEPAVLVNAQDLTERKAMEQALDESRRELQQLSWQLLESQEQERSRLAWKLHEGVGQSLVAVKFAVEHALSVLGESAASTGGATLRALIPNLQDAVDEVRDASMALRPPVLDGLGLLAAIGWLGRKLAAGTAGLRIEPVLEVAEGDVPDRLRTVVFRIIQEALENATRHAKANRIRVSLRGSAAELALEVADDGDGFDVAAYRATDPSTRGFGLSRIREWTELSGGQFTLESDPGSGTTVRVGWRHTPD